MADASGNVTGFDADVGNLLCAKLNMTCEFVVQAFDGLIPALKTNQFDIIISGMSISEERKKQIDFSVGYAEVTSAFAAPEGSDLLSMTDVPTLLTAIDGLKVGVQSGTTNARFIEARAPNVDLKTYDTLDQMLIDLASGRIETAFADIAALQSFLATPSGKTFQIVNVKFNSTVDPMIGSIIGVGIAHGNTELKAKVNQALCELVADKSIGKSSEKWFLTDISRPCE